MRALIIFAVISLSGCADKTLPLGSVFDEPTRFDYAHNPYADNHVHVPARCIDRSGATMMGVFYRPGSGCAVDRALQR